MPITLTSATTVPGEVGITITSNIDIDLSTVTVDKFSLRRDTDAPQTLSIKSNSLDSSDLKAVTLTLVWDTTAITATDNGTYVLRCEGIQDTNNPVYTLPDVVVETYILDLQASVPGSFAMDFSQDGNTITERPEGLSVTGITEEYFPDWAGEFLRLTSSANTGTYVNTVTSASTSLAASAPLEIQVFSQSWLIIGVAQEGTEASWQDNGANSLYIKTDTLQIMSGNTAIGTFSDPGGAYIFVQFNVIGADLEIDVINNDVNPAASIGKATLTDGANLIPNPMLVLSITEPNKSIQIVRTTTSA